MTSIARVDKIQKVADSSNIINKTGTDITLGQTGDDIIVPAGATITNNGTAVGFDTDTNDKVKVTTNDTTAGFLTSKILAGTNITLATGSPGGNETLTINTSPSLEWQTSIVTATTLTAVAGKGYWINTTSNVCTITLPASASVGDRLIFTDYARNWATNAVTINQNSLNFQGFTSPNPVYDTNGQSVDIVYSGATQGWIPVSDDDVANETLQPIVTDFLILAGGGSGAEDLSGAGGAGGLRSSMSSTGGGGSNETSLSLYSGTTYTVTVGAGYPAGNGDPGSGSPSSIAGSDITTITSVGGGEAGGPPSYGSTSNNGQPGGCGGGGRTTSGSGGAGTSNQGYAGSAGGSSGGGGGGGAGAIGQAGSSNGGNGGAGKANSITGSSVTYGGGGGGGSNSTAGSGGAGGGGAGSNTDYTKGTDGSANLGGGGGGGGNSDNTDIASGGSGIGILRLLTSKYTGTTTGSPTVTTDGSYKVIKFTGTGTYTA